MSAPTPEVAKQVRYPADPVTEILGSALPYAERLERLVDLFYAEGDMDFEDYLPHEIIADFQRTMTARKDNRNKRATAP